MRARDLSAVMGEPYHLEATARPGGYESGIRGRILQCTHSCLAVEWRLGAMLMEVFASLQSGSGGELLRIKMP